LAVGGDGTNHEVINGIIRQQTCPSTEITYGLIPIGTGNDWRRAYRIPGNIKTWISQIAQEKTVLQDIGRITYHLDGHKHSRYFTNVAGLAYDGFIARYISEKPARASNKFGYLFAVFKSLQQYKLQKARIEFENIRIEESCYTINAGICPYSGGGMRIVPHARPDDGLLALTIAGPLSKLGVLLNTPRFYNGHLDRHPKVDLFQTQQIKVTSLDERPIPVEADGEFLGYTPVEIEILPKILQVIVPVNYQKSR
jgi:diacylglycerol kinase family enzyme